MNRRVVITGIGCVGPTFNNVNEFRNVLKQELNCLRKIDLLEQLNFNAHIGGRALPVLPDEEWVKYYEVDRLSEVSQLASLSAIEAWRNAGLEILSPDSTKVNDHAGVLFGTGFSGLGYAYDSVFPKVMKGEASRVGSYAASSIMGSASSALISGILGLGNYCSSVSSACCSGTESILNGASFIKSGNAEMMVAGSAEEFSPAIWALFDAVRATNPHSNDDAELACRPLSDLARGMILASGAGSVVLEEYQHAIDRGATIYAEVLGGAMNAGGQRNGGNMTRANIDGSIQCFERALTSSGIEKDAIDYINGHLVATKSDVDEIKVWNAIFGKNIPYLNATKSITGHTLAACSSIETIASIIQMNDGFIHANKNVDPLHPEIEKLIDPEKVIFDITNIDLNIILNANFSFGDVNSMLFLKKYHD